MLRLMIAAFGGLQKDAEVLLDSLLANVFRPRIRAKRLVKGARAFFYCLLGFICHMRLCCPPEEGNGGSRMVLDFSLIYATLPVSIYFVLSDAYFNGLRPSKLAMASEDGVTILSTIVTLPRTQRLCCLQYFTSAILRSALHLSPESVAERIEPLYHLAEVFDGGGFTPSTIAPSCKHARWFLCCKNATLVTNTFQHDLIMQIHDAPEFFKRRHSLQYFDHTILSHAADFLVRRRFPDVALG